jgi:proline iminopeptidase
VLAAVTVTNISCRTTPAWQKAEVAQGTIEESGLFYRVLGSGPDTIVVLHGGPGLHMQYLLPAVADLAGRHTVVLYDMRGRGGSRPVADVQSLTVAGEVADLESIRRHFHLNRLKLLGHHWGAAVAALYAIQFPDRVDRIMMISPFMVHPSFAYEYGLANHDSLRVQETAAARRAVKTPADWSRFCQEHWGWFFAPTLVDPSLSTGELADDLCAVPPERLASVEAINRAIFTSLGSWSWRVELNALATPVLVVEGNGLPLAEQAATRWAQHLPNGRLITLSAPSLFPWTRMGEEMTRLANEFFDGQMPQQAIKPPPFIPRSDSMAQAG